MRTLAAYRAIHANSSEANRQSRCAMAQTGALHTLSRYPPAWTIRHRSSTMLIVHWAGDLGIAATLRLTPALACGIAGSREHGIALRAGRSASALTPGGVPSTTSSGAARTRPVALHAKSVSLT